MVQDILWKADSRSAFKQ